MAGLSGNQIAGIGAGVGAVFGLFDAKTGDRIVGIAGDVARRIDPAFDVSRDGTVGPSPTPAPAAGAEIPRDNANTGTAERWGGLPSWAPWALLVAAGVLAFRVLR